MMNPIVIGIVAGVLGTLVMDLLNHLLAQAGILSKIEVRMIGRMSAGWVCGRFRYHHPEEMEQVAHERLYGYVTHYTIGVGFAVPFMIGWDLLAEGTISPLWTLAFGIATTIAFWFYVYPSMGMGMFGIRSPEGFRNAISSLTNHLFYGMGMAITVILWSIINRN